MTTNAAAKSQVELEKESQNLRDELQLALLAAEDIRVLQNKESMLRRKMEMMADHMEKLMNHLRIEAKQKARIIDNRKKTVRELSEMREICLKQQKTIESKNR